MRHRRLVTIARTRRGRLETVLKKNRSQEGIVHGLPLILSSMKENLLRQEIVLFAPPREKEKRKSKERKKTDL